MASLAEHSKLLNSAAMLGTGTVDIAVIEIPSDISSNWLIPESLVLDNIQDVEANLKIYRWEGQDIALYSLCEATQQTANLLLIESVADPYRVGLLYQGNVKQHKLKISDIKDANLDNTYPYMFQAVIVNESNCMIPELDKLSHELIDLDR